ncbi:hypothetical protein H0H87_003929 [Tephrocybe sp. NHM501043]|nr:hypothetical protein H0H87_003929 [Tephrocybe sp. NHM501043]
MTTASSSSSPTPVTAPKDALLNLVVKEAAVNYFQRKHALGAIACMAASVMVDVVGAGSVGLRVMAQLPVIDPQAAKSRAEDVLAQSIAASKMMINVGEALPVPYVKAGAALVLAILEPWQIVRRNFSDYEEIVQMIRERVVLLRVCPQLGGSQKHLEALMTMLDKLHTTMKKHSFLKHVWKNYSIARMLLHLKEELVHLQMLNMYKALIPGEIQLQRWIPDALGNAKDLDVDDASIQNATVNIDGQLMTARYYETEAGLKRMDADLEMLRRLRGPNVLQLFGICSAALRPCLVFHRFVTPIAEQQVLKQIHPLTYLGFTHHLLQGYDIGHDYLRDQFPDNQCMAHPRPKARMYFSGCPCSASSSPPHSFHLESYANEHGKLILSMQTVEPNTPFPKAVQRQGYYGFDATWKKDPIIERTLDPFCPDGYMSETHLKHSLKAFHAAVLLQGYASPIIHLPPSSSAAFGFGEIWEMPNQDHLDDVVDRPVRSGIAVKKGTVQWPGVLLYNMKEQPEAVKWEVGENAVYEDVRGYKR